MRAFVIILACCLLKVQGNGNNPGVMIRLTQAGLKYAVDVAFSIMREKILNKTHDYHGQGFKDRLSYTLSNLKFVLFDFDQVSLMPAESTGMRARVNNINVKAVGNMKYNIDWFISFQDDNSFSFDIEDVSADLTVEIGADGNGRPTIALTSCSSSIGDINIQIHDSIFLDAITPIVEPVLIELFQTQLCDIAREEVNENAREKLRTFKVSKHIDEWAQLDYSLTAPPTFTNHYMDIMLKGEFKKNIDPVPTSLVPLPFPPLNDYTKMMFTWLSEYTCNTAGLVYHKEGFLQHKVAAWDTDLSYSVKSALSTSLFDFTVPVVAKKYPNLPMQFEAKSYRAPFVEITPGQLRFHVFADTLFSVRDTSLNLVKLFSINFDIEAIADLIVKEDRIIAKVNDFDYIANITKSYIGDVSIPVNSPLVKQILHIGLLRKGNSELSKGFPLPKVDDAHTTNLKLEILKGFILIGSDLKYVKPAE